jgi:predicted nucleic acid-binding Zn ribbon protein
MYCKRCGTNIPEKARFCPKCGETVSVNAAKKKKSHKVVALILSIVLVIGACSGVFAFREEVLSLIFGSKDVYLEVDGVLQEKIVCEEFQNASFDDRKAIAYETLSYLAKDGKIKEDSITYGENECFYFNYIDGGEGLIALYDKSNEIDGYEIFQDSVYYLNDDEIYSTIDKSGYRYSNENLKAVIVDCLGDTGEEILTDDGKSIRDVLKEDVKAWNANTMETDYYYECSIDDFKTILCGYDFIDIRCHGGTDKKGDPTIVVNESDGMFNQKYTDDVKAGRVGRSCGAFGGNYYMKNSFFSYYYNDKLNSSIIWIGCCSGYKNDVLVSTFANCGAKAVIAATDAVISGYGTVMTDAFVNGLLRCENVEDSLKFAKEKWGDNDKEKIYPNKKRQSGRI